MQTILTVTLTFVLAVWTPPCNLSQRAVMIPCPLLQGKLIPLYSEPHPFRIGDKIVTNEQWQQKKAKVMEAILIEKLKTCNKTKKTLMESGTQHIVEDTGHEFWGRGKSETGKNVLGKIWMDLREKIRTDSKFLERPRSFDHTHIKRHAWATRNDQPRCYQCGETGHIWRTCRKQEPVICWTCNTEGHKQKHCTYFSRQSRNYSWY